MLVALVRFTSFGGGFHASVPVDLGVEVDADVALLPLLLLVLLVVTREGVVAVGGCGAVLTVSAVTAVTLVAASATAEGVGIAMVVLCIGSGGEDSSPVVFVVVLVAGASACWPTVWEVLPLLGC